MTLIEGVNFTINSEEMALGLWEMNMVSKLPGGGIRRVQGIRVMRNQLPQDCLIDMGLESEWPGAKPFYIYSGVVTDIFGETHMAPMNIPDHFVRSGGYEPLYEVAWCQDYATKSRFPDADSLIMNLRAEITPDKIADHFADQSNWYKRRSTFGYGGQVIRSIQK